MSFRNQNYASNVKTDLQNYTVTFVGPNFDREVLQLAKINTTLENEYARATPLTVSTLPAICDSETDRLDQINSQLAILSTENDLRRRFLEGLCNDFFVWRASYHFEA